MEQDDYSDNESSEGNDLKVSFFGTGLLGSPPREIANQRVRPFLQANALSTHIVNGGDGFRLAIVSNISPLIHSLLLSVPSAAHQQRLIANLIAFIVR